MVSGGRSVVVVVGCVVVVVAWVVTVVGSVVGAELEPVVLPGSDGGGVLVDGAVASVLGAVGGAVAVVDDGSVGVDEGDDGSVGADDGDVAIGSDDVTPPVGPVDCSVSTDVVAPTAGSLPSAAVGAELPGGAGIPPAAAADGGVGRPGVAAACPARAEPDIDSTGSPENTGAPRSIEMVSVEASAAMTVNTPNPAAPAATVACLARLAGWLRLGIAPSLTRADRVSPVTANPIVSTGRLEAIPVDPRATGRPTRSV